MIEDIIFNIKISNLSKKRIFNLFIYYNIFQFNYFLFFLFLKSVTSKININNNIK